MFINILKVFFSGLKQVKNTIDKNSGFGAETALSGYPSSASQSHDLK